MKHTTALLAILFAVICCAPSVQAAKDHSTASSGKKHSLRYKFQMGEVLRYSVKHSANIKSTIEGTSEQAETTSESIKAWKVTDVLPSGEIEFVHVVEVVRMSNRVPNRALTKFDSEQDKTPPPGFEQAARAVGVPLSVIRMTPAGKIVDREEKHPQPPHTDDMPITLQLPQEPLAVGEQWDAIYNVAAERKNGDAVQVRTRRVCTLRKVKSGIAWIDVDYQILTPVGAYIESQLVERLAKGSVRFDMKKGRVVTQKFDVDRRIIGFSGATSSMHYVSRLEERLLKPDEKLARKVKKSSDRK